MKLTKSILFISLSLLFLGCTTTKSSQNSNQDSIQTPTPEKPFFEYCGDISYVSPKNVFPQDAQNQSKNLKDNWWQDSVFYHIWVKSFCDSNGDGCGDFKGIESKLDYIKNTLGCDAIWLSPIFECSYKGKTTSDNMHGYDTTDYYSVNDYFGTEEELIHLINACHSKNIKVIFDFVPNHCSNNNQWFQESAKNESHENWFMWNDSQLFWNNGMGMGNWHEYSSTRYYYGAFGSNMPDFNFRNYEVREEMINIARYWLNKGFDGIRVDAVQYLIETQTSCRNTNETHEWFKELRAELDKYESPKFMVGETWCDKSSAYKYFGKDDEFHMIFDFDQGNPCIQTVRSGFNSIYSTIKSNPSSEKSYGTFLGNHDEYSGRFGTTLYGDRKLINLATALSLLRPTVPFIYYGNELGMPETNASGDLRLRGNFNWNMEKTQETSDNSTLKLNNSLIKLRQKYPEVFRTASIKKLTVPNSIFIAYILQSENVDLLCFFNLKNESFETVDISNLEEYSSAALLIGDKSSPAIDFFEDSAKIKNVGPLSFRVYVLNQNQGENLFDDETYNEDYKIRTGKYIDLL